MRAWHINRRWLWSGPAAAKRKHLASYYLLRLQPGASAGQIKDTFMRLSKIYHPDNQQTGDHHKFIRIKEAYERIKQAPLGAAHQPAAEEPLSHSALLAGARRHSGGLAGVGGGVGGGGGWAPPAALYAARPAARGPLAWLWTRRFLAKRPADTKSNCNSAGSDNPRS